MEPTFSTLGRYLVSIDSVGRVNYPTRTNPVHFILSTEFGFHDRNTSVLCIFNVGETQGREKEFFLVL